jgi:hypothetical protein
MRQESRVRALLVLLAGALALAAPTVALCQTISKIVPNTLLPGSEDTSVNVYGDFKDPQQSVYVGCAGPQPLPIEAQGDGKTFYIVIRLQKVQLASAGAIYVSTQACADGKPPAGAAKITVVPACPAQSASFSNIADGAKSALACEWLDPNGVGHTLKALELYATNTTNQAVDPREAAKQALHELAAGAPAATGAVASYEELYNAAQGKPDSQGQPSAQGLTDFLKMLAEANTLKKSDTETASAYQSRLLAAAKSAIEPIFSAKDGKQTIAAIKASFDRPSNYMALYQLLNAYPTCKDTQAGPARDACDQTYVHALETLRAAYQASVSDLASLVSDKSSSATKSAK